MKIVTTKMNICFNLEPVSTLDIFLLLYLRVQLRFSEELY